MEIKHSMKIYKIVNKITGQFYIGSTINYINRQRQHFYLLKNKRHTNRKLQNSFNKYGIDNFEMYPIFTVLNKKDILYFEQYFLDTLNPYYNISLDAAAPMTNRKHSPETLLKFKNRKVWNKGIPRTAQEKLKMSESRTRMYGLLTKDEKKELAKHLLKYTDTFKGKHHTEENKKYFRSIRKSKKRIICNETGEIFEAQIDIQRKYGIKQGHISEHLNGKRKTVKKLTFRYED